MRQNPEGRDASRGQNATERCRACDAPLMPQTPTAPFCSERCRLADLNKWFSGDYKITRDIKDSDLETTE